MKAKYTGYNKTILQLDVESRFDNISYEKSMSLITSLGVGNKFLRSALKAGVLKERKRNFLGSPQDVGISSVLCNIALHGIEDLNNPQLNDQNYQRGMYYTYNMIFLVMLSQNVEKLLDKVLSIQYWAYKYVKKKH